MGELLLSFWERLLGAAASESDEPRGFVELAGC